MTRDELKRQIDELMRQYDEGEIDGATYAQEMMGLTTSFQEDSQDDQKGKMERLKMSLHLSSKQRY